MEEEGWTGMKRRNGKAYRKFKSAMGRVYWIEMKPAEVAEVERFRALVAMTPIIMIAVFAWAAGMLA